MLNSWPARPGQLRLTSKRWPDTWGTAGRLSLNTVRTAFPSLLARPEDKSSIPWLRLSRGSGQHVKKIKLPVNWGHVCVQRVAFLPFCEKLSLTLFSEFWQLKSQNSKKQSHNTEPKKMCLFFQLFRLPAVVKPQGRRAQRFSFCTDFWL